MFLEYLILYCFGSVFILVVIIALAIAEGSTKKSIREELHKHGYQLVSIKSTKRRFPVKESPMSFWEKHVYVSYSPGRYGVYYKEVTFKNDNNEIFQNIAAIERGRFFSTKVHFEVDLKDIKREKSSVS